jgi:hypothetical protein
MCVCLCLCLFVCIHDMYLYVYVAPYLRHPCDLAIILAEPLACPLLAHDLPLHAHIFLLHLHSHQIQRMGVSFTKSQGAEAGHALFLMQID